MWRTRSKVVVNSRSKPRTKRMRDSLPMISFLSNFLRAIFWEMRVRWRGWIS
jgi:hypothetical protein